MTLQHTLHSRRLSQASLTSKSNSHLDYSIIGLLGNFVREIVARDVAGRDDRRDRGERSTLFSRAHLKLRLWDVDLPAVDELDDELEVVEAHVLRHDDGRVFAGIRQKKFLKVGTTGRQHHLRTQRKMNRNRDDVEREIISD